VAAKSNNHEWGRFFLVSNPTILGYGIEALTWFEYALSTLRESTAVVT